MFELPSLIYLKRERMTIFSLIQVTQNCQVCTITSLHILLPVATRNYNDEMI